MPSPDVSSLPTQRKCDCLSVQLQGSLPVPQLLGIILPETRLKQLFFPNTQLQGKDVVLVLDLKILGLLEAGNFFH